MKIVFIGLLIAANALLFALSQGYLANPMTKTQPSERLLHQQNSQALKIISAQTATAAQVVPIHPAETSICLTWGAFSASQLKQVDAKLSELAFGDRQSRQAVQETTSTMVYFPPLGSKEAAHKKVSELSQAGVKDFFIIQDQSHMRWAISLGVFKSEAMAKQLLSTLHNKGFDDVKSKPHTMQVSRVDYVFKEVSATEKLRLEKLAEQFPEQSLKECSS